MNEIAPATTLRDTWNAANPAEALPSGDPRYVDCTEVRGDKDMVSDMGDTILWSDIPVQQLFTGHRGCGKSTELLRLKHRLEQENYAVIYFVALEDLDLNDVEYTDILITIAKQVQSGLKDLGIDLDEDLLHDVLFWVADIVYETTDQEGVQGVVGVEFGVGVSTVLAKLLAKVTGQVKTSHEQKRVIRGKLDPQISQLIENINLVLSDGRAKIKKSGKQDLVLIVDNLDRMTLIEKGDGRTSHEAIYIEHGEQLRSLDCHIVYTVPISMFYAPKARILTNIFPEYAILPMIKVQEKGGADCQEGLDNLHSILERRIALHEVFGERVVDYLCRACGGHVGDLMRLVRYACRHAREQQPEPIPMELAAVQRAEKDIVNEYGRMIPEKHFPLLARVHLKKAIENDVEHQLMLYNLSVLEYMDDGTRWHDVHPAVQKVPKFEEALERERQVLSQ